MSVTTVTTKKCVDIHDTSATTIVTSTDHPERPVNLGLVKQEVNLIDSSLNISNPASPISKQVSRSSSFLLSYLIFFQQKVF